MNYYKIKKYKKRKLIIKSTNDFIYEFESYNRKSFSSIPYNLNKFKYVFIKTNTI
jgi:hypothetical protein